MAKLSNVTSSGSECLTHKAYAATPNVTTLGALAHLTGAMLQGDPNTPISGVGTLQHAKPGTITFLSGAKYQHFLADTQAACVILTPEALSLCQKPALVCTDPKLVFAQVVEYLYPRQTINPGIHPTAVVDESAIIHPFSAIGPYCVIGKNTHIQEGVILQSHCSIGNDCTIGEGQCSIPKSRFMRYAVSVKPAPCIRVW